MAIKQILLAALAITATALAVNMLTSTKSNKSEHVDSFASFNQKFGKMYTSLQEREYRYAVYLANKQYIQKRNAEQSSFTLGETPYTDLTFEEFKAKYLGETLPNVHFNQVNAKPVEVEGEKDWRAEGKVTVIKNQAACGSCWAFSAVGALESAILIKGDKETLLSESELVDCSSSYGNHGCNGGLMSFAYDYIIDKKIGTSAEYPYRPVQGTCKASSTKVRVELKDYKSIAPISVDGLLSALKASPVAVALEVTSDFQHYTHGVFKAGRSCGSGLNHGVVAVGYSDKEGGYFIVKNSWGQAWGEQGYIRMAIGTGTGTCGIANSFDVIPVV